MLTAAGADLVAMAGNPFDVKWLPSWGGGSAPLGAEQAAWLDNWDRQLEAYGPLFDLCDGLWMLRPLDWGLPKRWSLQSVDQQRRLQPQSPKLDGWLKPLELDRLMNSSLAALPPLPYQEPLTAPTKGFGQLNGRRRRIAVEIGGLNSAFAVFGALFIHGIDEALGSTTQNSLAD